MVFLYSRVLPVVGVTLLIVCASWDGTNIFFLKTCNGLSTRISVNLIFESSTLKNVSPSNDFDDQPVSGLFRLGFIALTQLSTMVYIVWWAL